MIGALLLGGVAPAAAQDAAAPVEARLTAARVGVEPRPVLSDGLTVVALVQTKAVVTSLSSTNPFLDGQVVGVLGGTNGLTTSDEEDALYVEQRLSPFFTYAPPILDGRAALATGFEIDYAWGDRSYGVGGNVGGGFGADMVNLQTRRMHATIRALRGEHDLTVHAGLQLLTDGPFDPTASLPDDLLRTSGRLMLVGSEATGLAAYGRVGGRGGTWLRYRAGTFTLWESGMGAPDDVTLHVADARLEPTWVTGLGLHGYWLRDRSGGVGGILGVGPTSALSEMQGGPRLDLRPAGADTTPPVDTDVFWLAADASWNHKLDRGPVGASGFVAANVGRLYLEGLQDRSIVGGLADVELRARIAPGEGSVVRAEATFATADDPETPDYEGALTGNAWGMVGALSATQGTLLLLPDPFSIDRYTGVVHDVSNAGRGLLALTGSAGVDPVPNRVTVSVGGGAATSGGDLVGAEVNGRVVAEALLFLKLGLHGGAVFGTDLPATPWIVYGSLDWLVFK